MDIERGPTTTSYLSQKKLTGVSRTNWNILSPEIGTVHAAIKNHSIACIGEYVSTTLFLFVGLGGTNAAFVLSPNGMDAATLSLISLSFGFSLTVSAWTFYRISGGLFNPAISLGLALVGAITPLRACLLTVAQVLGAITASALINALVPGDLYVETLLRPGVTVVQGLFIETILTFLLMLTVFMLAAEKHRATFLAPVAIGLSCFIAHLFGTVYTGCAINPARSLGPAVIARSFPHYFWIYWVGPCLGATFAAAFYKFIKYMQYETTNPDQDKDSLPAKLQAAVEEIQATRGISEKQAIREIVGDGPGMISTLSTTGNKTSMGREAPVQGPGMNDLLTAPVDGSHDVLGVARLHALEAKLDLVLAHLGHHQHQHGPLSRGPSSAAPPMAGRQGTAVSFAVDVTPPQEEIIVTPAGSASLLVPEGKAI